MKKSNKILLVIVVLVVLVCMGGCNAYNGMVGNQEAATTALANVEATYQRRATSFRTLPRRFRPMPSTSAKPWRRW